MEYYQKIKKEFINNNTNKEVKEYEYLAKYYDYLLGDEEAFDFWLEYINAKDYHTVLELASGSGVLAGILKKQGKEVTASDISKEMNLKIVVLPIIEQETRLSECVVINNAGPKEFVAAVNGATMVCTDSFHMCAFSLNFQKEFWVFKRFNDNSSSSQNSRIDNLFSEFGINRYFNDGDRHSVLLFFKEIDILL